MDRRSPQVAKLQEHFIRNLVGSLFNTYSSAGFLPGILIEESENGMQIELFCKLKSITSIFFKLR